MPYTLVLGQKNYSSWSMRAWLLLKALGTRFDEVTIPLYCPGSREAVRRLGGATGLVPVLIDADTTVWDTLAIFEYLYETHPAVWPSDRVARARARSICGEVHSSFDALRSAMPFNSRARGRRARVTADVAADIARVRDIWVEHSRETEWLFGEFCGADVIFAPIAVRFQTYGVEVDGMENVYMNRLLTHPHVIEWLRLGREETDVIESLEVG